MKLYIHAASESTIADMRRDIEKTKRKLKKQKITENFGQDEVRRISDKYSDLMLSEYSRYSDLLNQFSDWCSNYNRSY